MNKVVCEDINGNTDEVQVSELSFRPAVYGVIVDEGKVLLSKQWDGYDFPGGGVKIGERVLDALVREVKEETGLDVEAGVVLHCQDSFFTLPYSDKHVHSIHVFYQCRIIGGEISTEFLDEHEKEYASAPEWVNLIELHSVKMYSSADLDSLMERFK
jgi:8-oxo-dGTP diphosphatase